MLTLWKAEGLPPHSEIAGCFEMKDFIPRKSWWVTLYPMAGETTGAFTITRSFQAEPAGRALKGTSPAPLQLPGCIKKAQHKQW